MPLLGSFGAAGSKGFGQTSGGPTVDMTYLVQAGGGGYSGMAAGGAGGQRNSYDSPINNSLPISLAVGKDFPVTVGAGGGDGAKGADSSIDIISASGGGVGSGVNGPGGCGGGNNGGGDRMTGNIGGYTPPEGQPGGNDPATTFPRYYGGGGGGVQGQGADATLGGSGGGGNGNTSSISGSPVARGGGGGAAAFAVHVGNGPGGPGGPGGGGRGSNPSQSSTSGSANTGGGSGGTLSQTPSGGSGVVYVRYTTADAPANITGGTKTTSGSDTIHEFTSSGTLQVGA